MFRWDIFGRFIFSSYFFLAAWNTLWVSVVAQTLGVIIGLFLALMLLSHSPWLAWPARAYIWFFRGSPLLVQVLLLWDGLPRLTEGLPGGPVLLSQIICVLVAFSLNEGAYMAEIIRAGITSVDVGQTEAAKSLGMGYWLTMRRIILPQAARVIIPPLGNEFNNMLKTTSIASVIGMVELTYAASVYGAPSFSIFELLVVATFYYLLMTTVWTYIQSWIEKRLDPDSKRPQIYEQKGWAMRMLGFGIPKVR